MKGTEPPEAVAIIIPLLLLFFLVVLPIAIRLSRRIRRTVGTVLSSEIRRVYNPEGGEGFIPVISYQYRFNGMEFTGITDASSGEGSTVGRINPWNTPLPYANAQAIVSMFTPGSPCFVYPDQSDNSRSRLQMFVFSSKRHQLLIILIAAAVVITAAAAAIVLMMQAGIK